MNSRLIAALEPFAELARVFDNDARATSQPKSGEIYVWTRMIDGKEVSFALTVEQLREARDAIQSVAIENVEDEA